MECYTGTLTDGHLAHIASVRDRWMTAALAVNDCDRATAEAHACAAYEAAGLPAPSLKIWMDSPAGASVAATALRGQLRDQLGGQLWGQLRGQLRDQLRDQLGDQLWDQLGGQLRGQLGDQLWDQLGGQLWGQLWDPLRDQLRDQLRGQLGGQLRGQLGDQLGGQLRGQLGDQLWGQLGGSLDRWRDAYWAGFYESALPIAGLPASPALTTLARAISSCGWWIPLRSASIMSAAPVRLRRDPSGALHSSNGMALAYSDGWGFHAWHGRRVPDWVITAPAMERIASEPNTEIRRCAVESMGWEKFLAALGTAPVATAPDPGNPGQHLTLHDVPEQLWGAPVRLLLCTNGSTERDGTRRRYGLTVPADIRDPLTAAAWTYGLTAAQYARAQRRT